MSPIRTYLDAWHGAMHAGQPLTGRAVRSLRPAAEPRPARPVTGTTPEPAGEDHWLDGPPGK